MGPGCAGAPWRHAVATSLHQPAAQLAPLTPALMPRLPTHATPQAARRKLANAVVCGYLSHADRRTHLNPPDGAVLSRGDKLIVLSRSTLPELAPGGSTAAGMDVEALRQRLEAAQPQASAPKSVVVVGWTGPTADLVVRPGGGG